MKRGKGAKKKERGRRRAFLLFFLVFSILAVGFLSFSLALTGDVSSEMDEALFQRAGADSAIHLFSRSTETEGWEETLIYGKEKCHPVSLASLPHYLPSAFVAMEDHRFYRHSGVDVLRTVKAAIGRVFGSGSFGGSTITQQLIKNIGGERERTVTRKLREITRAQLLETRHTKEEILEAYLNIIPLDEGCVGIGAGARAYFGKEAEELSLAEVASLVAMTPSPARLNPRKHPKENLARRNRVLARMEELGYITREEYLSAEATPLVTVAAQSEKKEPLSWYTEHLFSEVADALVARGYTKTAANALLYGGGIRIYSALDKKAQTAAEEAFASFAAEAAEGNELCAGTAIFSPQTGKLVALVGNLGEKASAGLYNYATDSRRAPGSALKPIALYAPALEEGLITEASVFDDVPKTFSEGGMWPHNTPDRYDGLILAKDALIHSKNTVAVDLYRRLGAEHVYAVLNERFRLGGLCRRTVDAKGNVRTDLAEAPLALGELTYGVSLYDITRAYLPFAAEGMIFGGTSFYWVEDAKGERLLTAEDEEERILSQKTASVMTHMLTGVVEEGSGKSISLSALVDTAGKTGSSGGNRDRWFIGYTPYYLCGIWCGYERGGTAVTGIPHLKLFDAVMTPLHQMLSDGAMRSFGRAPGLYTADVCKDSGKMLTNLCKEDERGGRVTEVWIPSGVHLGSCDTHVSVLYDDEMDGVAYPPQKGREGALRRVSLIRVPTRSFPVEVTVTDAEYVYRDPMGCDASEEDVPFFAGAIPPGIYIGKSHDERPFNAAAHPFSVPPYAEAPSEEEHFLLPEKKTKEQRLPTLPKRRRLPRLPFFGL